MPSLPSAVPAEVRCAQDYEWLAARWIAAPTLAHIAGGSGRDLTAAANLAAFSRFDLVPRLLRDVSAGHTRLTLGGQGFEHPLLLAPVALVLPFYIVLAGMFVHSLILPGGAAASARIPPEIPKRSARK